MKNNVAAIVLLVSACGGTVTQEELKQELDRRAVEAGCEHHADYRDALIESACPLYDGPPSDPCGYDPLTACVRPPQMEYDISEGQCTADMWRIFGMSCADLKSESECVADCFESPSESCFNDCI